MATKDNSMLNLVVVMVIAVVIFIIIFKLMWDWQERSSQKEPISDQFLFAVATAVMIGILSFVGFVVLTQPTNTNQFDTVIFWALAVQVFVSAYVAYFHHELKTESGYLLMILIALFAVLAMRLTNVHKYGAVISAFGVVLAFFLQSKALR